MKGVMMMSTLIMLVMTMTSSDAQSTECVTSLMPCSNYLKPSSGMYPPPASCCDPLKTAIAHNKECLCSILTNAEFLGSLGATPDDASQLPGRCNIAGVSSSNFTCSATSSPMSASPTNSPPPAVSGRSGGDRVAWSGFSFGLAVVTSFVFYLS